jgi:hypothetical protein
MYKPTIWQDHVEGVQEGTDMNAANFNNIEAGVMEASALAALNAAVSRYSFDMAKNAEVIKIRADAEGAQKRVRVDLPDNKKRNINVYNIVPVVVNSIGDYETNVGWADGVTGDIIIDTQFTDYFEFYYTGSATCVTVEFYISGGMA